MRKVRNDMAKCKNCKILCLVREKDGSRYYWCFRINDNPDVDEERKCKYYEVANNSDMIRKMTDEELEEFIHKTIFDQGSNMFTCEEPPVNCHEECKECYLDWLQKEVE